MRKIVFLFYSFFLILGLSPSIAGSAPCPEEGEGNDTIGKQILYNGRAWRNLYYRIKGDQFLFSTEFLSGSVSIDGKSFNNLQLRYDIYTDELMLITDRGIIIQLNKEMIDSFSLSYNDKVYFFRNLEADSLSTLSGYFNLLYEGKSELYVKYRKEILLLAVDNKYDLFNQLNRVYLRKDGVFIQVNGKRDLMGLLRDRKHEVRDFIKSNKIKISRKEPEAFAPVIEYYDKLKQ